METITDVWRREKNHTIVIKDVVWFKVLGVSQQAHSEHYINGKILCSGRCVTGWSDAKHCQQQGSFNIKK